MSDTTYVELDGSAGEGGGQILRSSLSLSLLTGRPFRLHNIRARRPKPGLQAQHLMSVQAAARVGNAEVLGASLGSSELTFTPGEVQPGHYVFDIGTAGATALVLHTIYLPLALRGKQPSHVQITGGTHVKAAPAFEFLRTTWHGYLLAMGLNVSLTQRRPGFYPRGGGLLKVMIPPVESLEGLTLPARGATQITGLSAVASLPDHIARRQARRARSRLESRGLEVEIEEEAWENGPASVLALTVSGGRVPAVFVALGERGKSAEEVADEAVEQVVAFLDAGAQPVDLHSADQLLLPAVFAAGPTTFETTEVTQHLLTNRDVIGAFLSRRVTITGEEGSPGRVEVAGPV
jgi:RNA 3'-terminal phosphate cyclase (ATP)